MIEEVDVILKKSNLFIDAFANEYSLIENDTCEALFNYFILKQLKISCSDLYYTKYQNQLLLIEKEISELERTEDSLRFSNKKSDLINSKDVFLYTLYSQMVWGTSQKPKGVVYGKKNELYFSYIKPINSNWVIDAMGINFNEGEKELLSQRYYILLNESSLTKIKTYILYLTKTNNLPFNEPEWFKNLLKK